MYKKIVAFVLVFVFLFGFVVYHGNSQKTYAQSDQQKLEELNRQIEEYTSQIQRLQTEASTLSNQIAQFNAKIALTALKIEQTQQQINLLGGRIDQLAVSLENLTSAFASRVSETYKMARIESSPVILLSEPHMNEAVSRYYYLQKIQEADRSLLEKLESAKTTYTDQKTDLEELEQVLGVQKEELDGQKAAKANLLAITRNDERRYQDLLEHAKAEFEAIQAIIAGRGDETEVGHVNAGDRIASVIQGASCNSNGAHLHFIVSENGDAKNPFNYLKPGIDHENCSGPGECGAGDPFNPSGSWEWPMNPKISYTQGYGRTWAVDNTWVGRIYSFHNGIDFDSLSSSTVKAVRNGTLFRGSFNGSGGCKLRYVRVDHDDSNIDTFYLHINY